MKAGQLTALILVTVPGAYAAAAAPFECSRAQAMADKVVCGDAELGELDRRLARLRRRSGRRTLPKAANVLRRDQEEWVRSVRDRCSDAQCLRTVYLKPARGAGRRAAQRDPPSKT